MSHPLDGAYAKLGRAQQHINEFKEEVEAFIYANDPKPYIVRRERHNELVEQRSFPEEMLRHRGLSPAQLVGPVK